MPEFSASSRIKLNSCNKQLQTLFEAVICKFDCTILEGYRSQERQEEMYRQGLSKVKPGFSKHNVNPSNAVDVAPYPIDWNDKVRFYYFAGYVKGLSHYLNIPIRWGGDWDGDNDLHDQTFMDLVHFELA